MSKLLIVTIAAGAFAKELNSTMRSVAKWLLET